METSEKQPPADIESTSSPHSPIIDTEKQSPANLESPPPYVPTERDEDAPEPHDPNARPPQFRSTTQEILFILTATMSVGMGSMLQGSTIVITSFIARDLHMTTSEQTWITASSALTSGAFLLFFGKAADLFGRRAMFIISLFLFSVFALATGFSPNAITLDALNAMMGLCSAAAIPPCQGILGTIYEKPSRRKNYSFACFSGGNPLGFVFGSLFSGIAAGIFNWRASFWLLALIYLVVTVIACFTVPKDTSEKLPLNKETLKQFDIVGTLLTIGGIGLFSAGLSTGSDASEGWKTPYIIVFLILGVLLLVAFVWWESKYPYPLMPLHVFRNKEFCLLVGIMVLGFLAFAPMTFYVALYLQDLAGYSALETAVHLLPMAISGILVNIVAGLLLDRVSNKLLMGIATVGYTIAFLLLAVQRTGDSYWAFTFPGIFIVVIGADLEFNVSNMYVLSSMEPSQQSIAGSLYQTFTKLAVAVGLGIYTAIFQSVEENPAKTGYYANNSFEPYAAVFWCGMACTFISVLLVPFLRIKTQGNVQS